jgi:hypothetical protein
MVGKVEAKIRMTHLPPSMIAAFQHRAARVAIAASSMRGKGNRGAVAAGRTFLAQLPLHPFGATRPKAFRTALDNATFGLVRAFPRGARHWGLARKGLNIFLRECLYTVYLSNQYSLYRAEMHFEIPLDSITGKALHSASDGFLPRWQTVRGLEPDVSDRFQAFATHLAGGRGYARVHLDAELWGQRLPAKG